MGKAPTNQVYLCLPAGLSVKSSEEKQRKFCTWVIHQGQEKLFIVEDWRAYSVEEYLKANAMYSFKAQTFYKSVQLVGVKALGA